MEVVNNSRYPCEVIMATNANRQRSAVVIIKATYAFPDHNDARPRPAEEQRAILFADRFVGEPGLSAPLEESEVAPAKPRCDVILNGQAHAENAKPVIELLAAIKVGSMEKRIQIVGDRHWRRGVLGPSPSKPAPFTSMPIHYSRAFGGSWEDPEQTKSVVFDQNPVGCGYAKGRFVSDLPGTPVPNLSQPGRVVTDCSAKNRAVAFGPIGRSWEPRLELAGTYDQNWIDNIFPLPPSDLRPAFYQSAPMDQQIEHPVGGETVALWHLHPERPLIRFALPNLTLPIHVVDNEYGYSELTPVVDTISIDAEKGLFTLLWRAQHPISRSLREIDAVVVGQGFRLWYGERLSGKACCDGDEPAPTHDDPIPGAEILPSQSSSSQQ